MKREYKLAADTFGHVSGEVCREILEITEDGHRTVILVVSNDALQGFTLKSSAAINLTAGLHTIKELYYPVKRYEDKYDRRPQIKAAGFGTNGNAVRENSFHRQTPGILFWG